MNSETVKIPLLSIIIVNWNSGNVLIDCIASIHATVKVPFEIIVVDNNSQDASVSMVKKVFQGVSILEQKENLGYSKGNNLGVKYSKGQYILILNPDTILLDDAVGKMMCFLKKDEGIGIAGPKILKSDSSIAFNGKRKLPTLFWGARLVFSIEKILGFVRIKLLRSTFIKKILLAYYEKTEECESLQGCCIMLRRDMYELLGGFDESVPMYLDDIDLFYRCRKRGFKNFYVSEAEIVHLERYSTKTSESYKLYDVLCLKGLLFYYRKHLGRVAALLFRLILLSSVPYLLLLDTLSLPYFLIRSRSNEVKWLLKKHLKFLELAVTGDIVWNMQK